jgi:single-strand DNA-binding protein
MAEIRLPEQNTVLLTGRLTRDAELKYTTSGTPNCRFALAVNRNIKDSKTGEWKEDVTYVNVSVWREAAERCGKILKKGSPVHVEGRLRSYEYQDKDGKKRSGMEVEARRVQILEKASSSGAAGGTEPDVHVGADIEEVPF